MIPMFHHATNSEHVLLLRARHDPSPRRLPSRMIRICGLWLYDRKSLIEAPAESEIIRPHYLFTIVIVHV